MLRLVVKGGAVHKRRPAEELVLAADDELAVGVDDLGGDICHRRPKFSRGPALEPLSHAIWFAVQIHVVSHVKKVGGGNFLCTDMLATESMSRILKSVNG